VFLKVIVAVVAVEEAVVEEVAVAAVAITLSALLAPLAPDVLNLLSNVKKFLTTMPLEMTLFQPLF
jgi:hypothetical protein